MTRYLNPRRGENLRDAELRWQRVNDPKILAAKKRGDTQAAIAHRFGVSSPAIYNSLARSRKAFSADPRSRENT